MRIIVIIMIIKTIITIILVIITMKHTFFTSPFPAIPYDPRRAASGPTLPLASPASLSSMASRWAWRGSRRAGWGKLLEPMEAENPGEVGEKLEEFEDSVENCGKS